MTQSTTITASQTFTITDARYLASRIASDLTQLRIYYGHADSFLTPQKVEDFAIEAAILLKFGLLDTVKYGFRRNGNWVIALSYKANSVGQLVNDSPGDVYAHANVTGASFYSHLTKRHNADITEEDKASIVADLPIQRGGGVEPGTVGGAWDTDKSYYRNGTGIQRGQFRS